MREKKEINVEIGERARRARVQAKLTQEQLAERIEVSTQYISDMERGIVGISVPTLRKLCLALNVSSDRLLFSTCDVNRYPEISEKKNLLSFRQTALLQQIIESYIEAVSSEK